MASSDIPDREYYTSISSSISFVAKTSSMDELDLLDDDTNDQRSAIKKLIRYIMHTFYDVPQSLVVEYIYHHQCINLEDLADLLHLNSKQVYSYIQQFKCDRFIIEKCGNESSVVSKSKPNPNELYYEIDIVRFVNVVKYRLINMRTAVETFERQALYKHMDYECVQCSKEYTQLDIGKLCKNNSEGTLICLVCGGIVNENNQTEQKTERYNIRLFNETMTRLFEVLKRIDEIMINEHSTRADGDIEVTIEKEDDTNVKLTMSKEEIAVKPLPEWFVRSTVYTEPAPTNSSLNSSLSSLMLLEK
jgi:transcription initiation factor IIE alpha subunit